MGVIRLWTWLRNRAPTLHRLSLQVPAVASNRLEDVGDVETQLRDIGNQSRSIEMILNSLIYIIYL